MRVTDHMGCWLFVNPSDCRLSDTSRLIERTREKQGKKSRRARMNPGKDECRPTVRCVPFLYTRVVNDGKNRIRFGMPFEVVKVFLTVIPDLWLGRHLTIYLAIYPEGLEMGVTRGKNLCEAIRIRHAVPA